MEPLGFDRFICYINRYSCLYLFTFRSEFKKTKNTKLGRKKVLTEKPRSGNTGSASAGSSLIIGVSPKHGVIRVQNQTPDYLKRLILNQNKEQEKVVLFYSLFILGLCWFLAGSFELWLVILFTLLGILLVYCTLSFFFDRVTPLVKDTPISQRILGGVFFLAVLLFLGRYVTIAAIIIIYIYITAKKTYLEKNEKNSTFSAQFLKGFDIIDYHFNKEFSLFNHIQKYNAYIGIFFMLSVLNEKTISQTDFLTPEILSQAQFILCIIIGLNILLGLCIQFIIIDCCNPSGETKLAHQAVLFGKGFFTVSTGAAGIYIKTARELPGLELPGTGWLQETEHGFKYKSIAERVLGEDIQTSVGSIYLPLNENKFIDADAARDVLITSNHPDYKGLIRPTVVTNPTPAMIQARIHDEVTTKLHRSDFSFRTASNINSEVAKPPTPSEFTEENMFTDKYHASLFIKDEPKGK